MTGERTVTPEAPFCEFSRERHIPPACCAIDRCVEGAKPGLSG